MDMGELEAPRLTALTCMHEKPLDVMLDVRDSLYQDGIDQRVFVLDRPSDGTAKTFDLEKYVVALDGPPGWRSPCLSWNAGMQHVIGDHLLILQGDIVLTPGSVQHARQALQERPAVYFGMVLESEPEKCVGAGHAGPVLCSSTRPRPLTYLLAVPTKAVRAIGGWDEAFQAGVWYEDDDFTARLWKHGLDFIFDDRISGIHQSHPRPYAKPIAIAANQAIFLQKHGTTRFFDREHGRGKMVIEKEAGRTIWRHA